MAEKDSGASFAVGFLFGAVVGVAIGFLYAPKPGRETRAMLKEKAETAAEKRRAYCHCNMIKNHLDEMNATFCYCGAGWYRQLWEGILERPVRIELVKSLVKGDDVCQVAIHLPQDEQASA